VVEHTEARVRAALHAYADLVGDEPRELPARPAAGARVPAAPQPMHRRWRAPALVAAAVVAVVSGTVWLVAGQVEEGSVAASAPVSTDAGNDAAQGPAAASAAPEESGTSVTGGQLVVPAPAEVGVAYPFDLYTHCGVRGADVAGTWFAADPPLVEGAGNPPAGWGNPYQRGTLTLLTPSEALFLDDAGHELRLRAAPESARPGPCD
jgi:hypothetical protein